MASFKVRMDKREISELRLHNQYLLNEKLNSPQEVVQYFCAIQAQDYQASKWGISLRLNNTTDKEIENACNEGLILRTHVMRPTWHFVSPENIRWMLELTAPKVKTLMNHYNRKLELDEYIFNKCDQVIRKALIEKKFLTRGEIADVLEEEKIIARGQRLGHIMMNAELQGVVCSGPRKGKQFTYALLDTRTPKYKRISREEAIAKLTLYYFKSHGPAQIKDFSWWSGLTIKDAVLGTSSIKSKLYEVKEGSNTYWAVPQKKKTIEKRERALLLSIYDEYVIAYKDRSALQAEKYVEKMIAMGNALTAVVIANGKLIGTWKRKIEKKGIKITINPFVEISKETNEELINEVKKYGKFIQQPIVSLEINEKKLV